MKQLFLALFAVAGLIAADATGKWSGTMTAPSQDGGDRTGPALLDLKQDGAKVTGSAGPDAGERHEIQNGKAEDGILTFEVVNDDRVMKFTLKQEGDAMKGEIARERDGQTQKAKLDLKREK
jgi:hypothetical protein